MYSLVESLTETGKKCLFIRLGNALAAVEALVIGITESLTDLAP
ncbi:MAG: hypothetical protein ACM3XO_10125 [Bacteroidota bacterium]